MAQGRLEKRASLLGACKWAGQLLRDVYVFATPRMFCKNGASVDYARDDAKSSSVLQTAGAHEGFYSIPLQHNRKQQFSDLWIPCWSSSTCTPAL